MTIDSLKGDKSTRIMHQSRDKLNSARPIDFLSATRPVIIVDEPQNMESELSKSAVLGLNPLCTLRYSATHRTTRNVVYRLDPVQAHELGLVKQIVVAEVVQEGADAVPYIKLLDVRREPTFQAELELSAREPLRPLHRRAMWVKKGQDLGRLTHNAAYGDRWRLNEISYPAAVGPAHQRRGAVSRRVHGRESPDIHREMIRETIRRAPGKGASAPGHRHQGS